MDGSSRTAIPLECLPRCPWRPPDWRWRAATWLSGQDIAPRWRWLDTWVRRAARRTRPDTAVAGALAIRANGTTRVEVEARVLAGESAETIADRCGLDPVAVETYERLFFAMADVLDATDHVVFMALAGLHADEGPDIETVVKAFAYFGGPSILDVVLHALGMRPAPPDCEPSSHLIRLAESAIAAKRLGPRSVTPAGMARLIALSDELDRREVGEVLRPLCRPLAPAVGQVIEVRAADAAIGIDPVAPALRPPIADIASQMVGVRDVLARSA